MDPQGSSQSSVWSQSSVRRKRPKTGSEILHLLSKSAKTRATSSVTTTTTTTTATTDTGRHASSIQLVRDTQEETAQQRKRPRIRLEFDSPEQQRVRALEKLDEFKKRYSSLRCSDNAARKPNFNFAFRHRRDYRHKDLADFDDKLSEITYSTDTDFSLFAPSLRESQQDEDVASFVSESEISVDLRGWEPPLDTIMESEGLNVETQPLSSLESEQQKEPKGKEPIRQIRSAEPSAVEGRETQQETERAESPALDRHKQKTTVNEKRSEELAIVTTASEKAVEPISIDGNDKQITSPAKQDIGETTATQLDTQPPVNFDDAFYDIPDNDFGEYETDQPGPSAVEKPPSIPPLSPGPVLSNGQPSIDDNASAVALLEEGEEDRLIAQMERSSLTRRVPPGDTFISNKIRERQEAIRQGRPIDRGVRHCPINVTKRLFSTFTSMKLEADVQKKIEEASNLFLEQLADDLSTYADHARRGMITPDDVTLLMKRQGLLTEQTSLEALAHERLPRELWDSICVSALAHNALYPEDFDEEEEY